MIRKITSKHDEEKRRKKNQVIIGVVLVFLMLFSILGYSFSSNPSQGTTPTIKYNGYDFTTSGGYWNLNIGGTVFIFATHPANAYKIDEEAGLKSLTSYYGKPLYLYSESYDAETEVYSNLYSIPQGVTNACPEGESCDGNLSVKTCSDNFIIIKESETTRVWQEEGCVYIEGTSEELINIVDGFLLKIIGVN